MASICIIECHISDFLLNNAFNAKIIVDVYLIHFCVSDNLFTFTVQVRSWELGPRGLVYDREWMVTTETGVCLSQKREPRLCLIKPEVDLKGGKLRLRAEGKGF